MSERPTIPQDDDPPRPPAGPGVAIAWLLYFVGVGVAALALLSRACS